MVHKFHSWVHILKSCILYDYLGLHIITIKTQNALVIPVFPVCLNAADRRSYCFPT